MERIYLQWNLANWVTVVLMAVIGYALVGFIAAGIKGFTSGANSAPLASVTPQG
jgi:hypothetical protein